jgi:hypothetical protein
MEEKYLFALFGIALGSILSAVFGIAREIYAEYRAKKKDAEYLAIRVVCIFESFIEGCSSVVNDDGLCHGLPDSDGYSVPQVPLPHLEFDIKDANWKSLPSNLMFDVLNFPSMISDANNFIDSVFEHVAIPPDLSEGFEERQFQYSKLGLKAVDLSIRIRDTYNLPCRETKTSGYDAVDFMRSELQKILELRDLRAKEHAKQFQTVKSD